MSEHSRVNNNPVNTPNEAPPSFVGQYGVITHDHVREYISGRTAYNIYHYQGQVVFSDGEEGMCLDDYHVQAKIVPFHRAQFADIKALKSRHEKEMNALLATYPKGDEVPVFTRESIDWFLRRESDKNALPIRWFSSYTEAMEHHRPAPNHRILAENKPV